MAWAGGYLGNAWDASPETEEKSGSDVRVNERGCRLQGSFNQGEITLSTRCHQWLKKSPTLCRYRPNSVSVGEFG